MSKREELIQSVLNTPAYRSMLEKMSEEEKKSTEDLLNKFVEAFVPALDAFEEVMSDPRLSDELMAVLQPSEPVEHSKDGVLGIDKEST